MSFEAETLSMLYLGFFIVIVSVLMIIIKLWFETKENIYVWFIAQLTFLSFGFFKFVELIKPNTDIPDALLSEENSLTLGITGLLWAISMVCMIIGIWFLGHERNKK